MTALSYKKILVILCVTLGLLLRLYQIDSRILGWHSHRQADTFSVTQFISQNPNSFFLPKYHDLSHLQSGLPNPQGLRLVELPVYNLLSWVLTLFSSLPLLVSSRLVTIFSSLVAGLFIFRLFNRQKDFWGGLLALAAFMFLPYSIFYSRSVLPEMLSVAFGLASLLSFTSLPLVSALCLALVLLVKPFFAICLLPAFIYLLAVNRSTLPQRIIVAGLFLLTLVPVFIWRQHISLHPEGIPSYSWLFNNSTNPVFPEWFKGINLTPINRLEAFRPHWWYWLFYQRLFLLIMGFGLALPYLLGLIVRHPLTALNRSLFLGTCLYFALVAGGNLRHDYYQIFSLPQIALSIGIGLSFLIKKINPKIAPAIVSLLFAISLVSTYPRVKSNYLIYNSTQLNLADIAKSLIPQNALVIAPNMGDTTFLYFLSRSGYPLEMENIDELLTVHRQDFYLITTDRNDYYQRMLKMGTSLYSGPQGFIVKIPYEPNH